MMGQFPSHIWGWACENATVFPKGRWGGGEELPPTKTKMAFENDEMIGWGKIVKMQKRKFHSFIFVHSFLHFLLF
jgi:hypothetical protein